MTDTVFFEDASMDFCRFGHGSENLVVIPGLSVFKVSPEEESLSKVLSDFTDDFTVYVFDRRNNIPENYTIEDMANDTFSAMKALNLDKIYLFGASQGGMIALSIAACHSELVEGLVVAASAPGINECLYNAANDLISYLKTIDLDEFNKDMLPGSGKAASKEDITRSLLLAPSLLSYDLRPVLKNIKCRCLVIGSENDSVMSPDGSREIAELLGCEIYMYGKEYSHAVFAEAPDFHKRVYDFLIAVKDNTAET